MATLRVVTWNVRAAIGTGPFPDRWWERVDAVRQQEIGAFIGSLEADLVALQEVALVSRAGTLIDQAGELGDQLGLEVRYGAVRTFAFDGGAGLFGNAILARGPLADARTVSLPQAPASEFVEPPGADHAAAGIRYTEAPPTIREPRCLLVATISGLRVGTTHLSHVGSGERRLQAEATVAAFAEASPALLLGDLNAAIDAPELAPLAGWTDAFAQPAGSSARTSTDDGLPIDHILLRGGSVATAARVIRAAGELSDHFPVMAELSIGSG